MHISLIKVAKGNIKTGQAAKLVNTFCQQTGKQFPKTGSEFIRLWKIYNIKAAYSN